jgi:hypothetical protein
MKFDPDELNRKAKQVAREAVDKRAAAAQSAFERVFDAHANGTPATIEAALTRALAGTNLLGKETIGRFAREIANGKRVRVRTNLSELE